MLTRKFVNKRTAAGFLTRSSARNPAAGNLRLKMRCPFRKPFATKSTKTFSGLYCGCFETRSFGLRKLLVSNRAKYSVGPIGSRVVTRRRQASGDLLNRMTCRPRLPVELHFLRRADAGRRRYLHRRGISPVLQIVAQFAAAAGVTQTTERLGLDLANALTGHAELLAHLFQGVAIAVHQAKAQL